MLLHAENQSKYSAYGMNIFPCFWGGITLDKKLAKFLKTQRGDMTFAQFSKKGGFAAVHDIQAGAV